MSEYLKPPRFQQPNPDYTSPATPPGAAPFTSYGQPDPSLPPTPQTSSPAPPHLSSSSTMPSSGLTPYLALPPRLLLSTLSPALLPLILTIAHLSQNRASTAALASTLKSNLLSACGGLAKGAASLQSIPRYLAMQTNDEVVRAAQASILLVGAGLMDCITIVEKVLEFMLDTYRSLLMCTIQLAVQGTLDILISAVQTISDAITTSLNSLRTNIQNDILTANNVIQAVVSKLNAATSLVGVRVPVPQFDIPSLDALSNVKVPTTFEDALLKLNASMPSLDTVRDKINALIDVPFEDLKKTINASRLEMAASFNSSILPVPSLSSLSAQDGRALSDDLCSGLDTSVIDDTASALHKLGTTAIGLMCLVLVLCWLALLVWEWRRWRALKQSVGAVDEEMREGRVDPWRIVAVVEHPVLERYSNVALRRLARGERTRTNLRWLASYLSHPTSIALLCVALIGFLSVEVQLLALNAIKAHARDNANSTVTASTETLVAKLNAMAANSSLAYATEFNRALATYEARINDELFGTWINHTAVVLDSTLVTFYDEVETVLSAAFGNTVLFNPINTFIYCILGSKIADLEAGLTWVSQHAQITLPLLPSDVLTLNNASMNELVAPVTAAAVGSGSGGTSDGEDHGLVGNLISHFESALVAERTFYAVVLGVWVGVALIGVAVVLWHSGGRDRFLAWKDRRRALQPRQSAEQGGRGRASRLWPWQQGPGGSHPIYDQQTEKDPRLEGAGTADSFFHYPPGSTGDAQPGIARAGTFGLTLSMLAAPGQAFLRLAGRTPSRATVPSDSVEYLDEKIRRPSPTLRGPPSRHQPLSADSADGEGQGAPIWVDRWYRVLDSARSALPFRGQRLGAALHRGASQRTARSFGGDRADRGELTASLLPQSGWPGSGSPERDSGAGRWGCVDPQLAGRALDGQRNGHESEGLGMQGRYPSLGAAESKQQQVKAGHSGFPRPLSRAPTLPEGERIRARGEQIGFYDRDEMPPLPAKDYMRDPFVLEGEDDDIGSEHFDRDPHADPGLNAKTRTQTNDEAFSRAQSHLEIDSFQTSREEMQRWRGADPFAG